jgi:hypothetical protein
MGADNVEHLISAAASEKDIYEWAVPSIPSLDDAVCGIANRNLSQREWAAFVPGEPYQRTCPSLAERPPAIGAQPLSPAAQIIVQLGRPVLRDYDTVTDPDQLLGLPGQYFSRAAFDEGSVEVFSTAADRDGRIHYLASTSTDLLYQADYAAGRVLLRVSATAGPRADGYGRQLRSIQAVFQ